MSKTSYSMGEQNSARSRGLLMLRFQSRVTVGDFSFVEGIILITGITLASLISLIIRLIRGDVDFNGKVDVFDLRTIAALARAIVAACAE